MLREGSRHSIWKNASNTEEIEPGINADYDSDGHLVGIEVLSVSKRDLSEVKAGV